MRLLRLVNGLCCILVVSFVNAGLTSDGAALCDFYRAQSLESRGTLANWCAGSDPKNPCGSGESTWHGVVCATVGGVSRVVALQPYRGDQAGSLPSTLGNLNCLTSLHLSWKSLSGTIPSQLGLLTNLKILDLGSNKFTGSIPSTICNLLLLTFLDLSRSGLTGSIPSQLGQLTNLQELYLFRNQLTGSLPSTLGTLLSLTLFSLDENNMSGSLPSELGLLTNLHRLDSGDNQFSGSIPSQLVLLPVLNCLNLKNNQLTGPLPTILGNALYHLNLASNRLSGPLPLQLGLLPKIYELHLQDNQFTSAVPETLCSLKVRDISTLDISMNPRLTCLPPCLAPPPPVLPADLLAPPQFRLVLGFIPTTTYCKFTFRGDALPVCIEELIVLQATYDDGAALCALYDALTAKPTMDNWTCLTSSSGPHNPCLEWAGVTCTDGRVTKIELGYKDLAGPLSSAIGSLGAIASISIRGNNLIGSLPSELGLLKNLRELYLDDNQFTSAVPASLCDLSESIDLQLNGNPGLTCLPSCLTTGCYTKLINETAAVCAGSAGRVDVQVSEEAVVL